MKVDKYGCIIMEQNPEGDPGNLGDSCAETSRHYHTLSDLNCTVDVSALLKFITGTGYIRHPESPWKENDFSSDQALPLFLCLNDRSMALNILADQMRIRIKNNWYRTGNNNLVTPALLGFLKNWKWLVNESTAIQSRLFTFPYRWSDEKKWFEKSIGSSGDYQNWIQSAIYCPANIRRLIPKSILKQKTLDYYSNEPNHTWVTDPRLELIDKYFFD